MGVEGDIMEGEKHIPRSRIMWAKGGKSEINSVMLSSENQVQFI